MANEQEQPKTIEPLGPAYDALQRRLLEDGAAWRAGLPSTERLEQRLKALSRQAQPPRLDAEPPARGRLRLMNGTKGDPPVFNRSVKTITAVVAIAAVVALFVVLFQGFVGRGHPSPGSSTHTTPTISSTASPTPSPTPQPDLAYRLPIIAPSHPQTVYRLALANGSEAQFVLQTSADSGVTWRNFALPAQSNGPQPSIFVSPIDSQEVYLTLGGTLVNNRCVPQGVGSNSTFSSGNNVCGLQYVSQDGGARWSNLSLPSNDVLSGFPVPGSSSGTNIHVLQTQGTGLYSALEPLNTGAYVPGVPGPRLVYSDPSGLLWQEVDKGLPLATNTLCDAAPAPFGTTVFALLAPISSTSASDCAGGALALWRSDDGGAHWVQVGPIKGNVDLGMTSVYIKNGVMPLLYLNTGSSVCPNAAYSTLSPDSGICGGSPTDLQVSADGGKTWHAAPTQGYPDQKLNPGHPLGVLNDGSVLFLVNNQVYSWKSGDASWKRVVPTISGEFQYALVTTESSGQQTLWLVTSPGSSAYAIKSYPL